MVPSSNKCENWTGILSRRVNLKMQPAEGCDTFRILKCKIYGECSIQNLGIVQWCNGFCPGFKKIIPLPSDHPITSDPA